nr:hypothetical protein [Shimazuella soli]
MELFISKIKDSMKDSLSLLNQGSEEKSNPKVVITTKNNKGWMKVTPLEKQEEP